MCACAVCVHVACWSRCAINWSAGWDSGGSGDHCTGPGLSSGPPGLSVLLLPQAIKIRVFHRK